MTETEEKYAATIRQLDRTAAYAAYRHRLRCERPMSLLHVVVGGVAGIAMVIMGDSFFFCFGLVMLAGAAAGFNDWDVLRRGAE